MNKLSCDCQLGLKGQRTSLMGSLLQTSHFTPTDSHYQSGPEGATTTFNSIVSHFRVHQPDKLSKESARLA